MNRPTTTFCWAGIATLFLLAAPALAGESPTQREVDNLRRALLDNFEAQSREDVKGVLDSLHPLVSRDQRDELKRELESCFGETNLAIRLVSMNVHSYENPITPGNLKMAQRANGPLCAAYADVVQLTLPATHSYADLEEYPAELTSDYRHNSAMLPTHQLVAYTVRFEYDYRARKWKLLRIVSNVTPVNQWPENTREIMQGAEPATTCRDGIVSEPAAKGGRRK